jgi:hypothetical protein
LNRNYYKKDLQEDKLQEHLERKDQKLKIIKQRLEQKIYLPITRRKDKEDN